MRHKLIWSAASTLVLNALTLGLNVVTGVLVARNLGTAGRGQLTAIMTAPQLIGWIFAMGCFQAASYHQARNPKDAARLLSTWALILLPASIAAVIAGEVIIRWTLAAQAASTIRLAQIYMLTVLATMAGDLLYGVLLGDQDFLFYNLLRVAQPAAIVLAYLMLWRVGALSVPTALAATAITAVAGLCVAGTRAFGRYGIGRPSWDLARSSLWYGARAHGTNVSDILNTRLDLVILPAFLSASSVGIYSVATTVSGLTMSLTSAVSMLVVPLAARDEKRSALVVVRLTQITIAVAVVLALVLAVVAAVGIRVIYGSAFTNSVPLVWLLLPGTVAYSAAAVLRPGLYALNRPLTAASTYAIGLLLTIPGLLVFLRTGGLFAAALVSTASYTAVLIATIIAYQRASRVPLSLFFRKPADLSTIRSITTTVVSNGQLKEGVEIAP